MSDDDNGQQEKQVEEPTPEVQEHVHPPMGRKRKIIIATLVALLLTVIIAAVPQSRYGVAGLFVKRNVSVVVYDSTTKKPVSEVRVRIGENSVLTDKDGKVVVPSVPAGEYALTVVKKYYKDGTQNYTVPIFENTKPLNIYIRATGRQVPVTIINKISHDPLDNVKVTVGDTSATTDKTGVATVVLPTGKSKLSGTLELDGYNKLDIQVAVTEDKSANKFSLVPSGRIFYLSKLTGKINVMSANLDGGDASVAVKATGNEDDRTTTLLAARDWRYLALLAKRDPSQKSQLFAIDAKTSQLKLVDQGKIGIQLVGWWDHRFVYVVTISDTNGNQISSSLKSYDADTGTLTRIDELKSSDDSINNTYLINGKVIYTEGLALMSMNVDGSNKHQIKKFVGTSSYPYIDTKLYEPAELYVRFYPGNGGNTNPQFYTYEDETLKTAKITDDTFYSDSGYPTYLLSPSGRMTFWYEERDGKNSLFVGDANGKNPKTLANLSDYSTYGWFTDDYVLVSKDSSELSIASATKPFSGVTPLKVTDYHKPQNSYYGYGSGYGGQ